MIRAPSGISGPGRRSGYPRAVPALVVVQDPLGDRLDPEAVEHPESDLRVTLEHEPLGPGQRAGLAQDLLGDRELAEVVQAAGEPRELDLLLVEAEARRDAGREVGHARGMAARVRVAKVDRLCQARGGPERAARSGPVASFLSSASSTTSGR